MLFELFWGWGRVRKLFLNHDIQIENFHFLNISLSCILMSSQFRVILGLLRRILAILGVGVGSETPLRSPHIGYQLSFSACSHTSAGRFSQFEFKGCANSNEIQQKRDEASFQHYDRGMKWKEFLHKEDDESSQEEDDEGSRDRIFQTNQRRLIFLEIILLLIHLCHV